jgi:hypothetical protein
MIQTGLGLPMFFIAVGLVVAGSIVCGLLGEQLRIRTIHHSPQNSSAPSGK